jgi:hypothetical protein
MPGMPQRTGRKKVLAAKGSFSPRVERSNRKEAGFRRKGAVLFFPFASFAPFVVNFRPRGRRGQGRAGRFAVKLPFCGQNVPFFAPLRSFSP